MDAADLRARALKAREFTHTIGDRTVTLRVPTRVEVRQAAHERRLLERGGSIMALQLLQHALLLQGIVGWTGLRERDVLPASVIAMPGDDAPLPWSEAVVALYLDAQPDDADVLGAELFARANLRKAAIETDAKNSQPTSPAPAARAEPPYSG